MILDGRAALVTGAGRRLGRSIAMALAGRGMQVAAHYHSSSAGAEELCRQIRAAGGRAEPFGADLSDAAAARALAGRVARQFGRLDVLVNSAGIMVEAGVESTTPEVWDQVMNLNLRGMFFCSQGAIEPLRTGRGKIVNLADVGGLEVWPRYAAHCISKAAVVMLTRMLARTLAPEITVNAVAPGAVLPPEEWSAEARDHLARTTPLKRLGSPEDVVAAILFLLEHGDYITGETIVVDGGRLLR